MHICRLYFWYIKSVTQELCYAYLERSSWKMVIVPRMAIGWCFSISSLPDQITDTPWMKRLLSSNTARAEALFYGTLQMRVYHLVPKFTACTLSCTSSSTRSGTTFIRDETISTGPKCTGTIFTSEKIWWIHLWIKVVSRNKSNERVSKIPSMLVLERPYRCIA